MLNPTIARITARALIGRRRFLFLLLLPLLMVGLALLANAYGDVADWGTAVIVELGFKVVLPVTALIVGTGVLGSEIDDGTIAHILAKPISRTEIVVSKVIVAVLITWVTAGVPLAVTGLIGGSTQLAAGLVVGALVGALAYSALFAALSLLSRRPVIIGLIYVLLWEGLFTTILSGTRVLSIRQYALTVAQRVADTSIIDPQVGLPVAIVATVVITVAATWLTIDRLRSFAVVGETS